MKKLFFAAALAVVAIGGALTTQALTVYLPNSSSPIICSGTGTTCSAFIAGRSVYSTPNHLDNGIGVVDPATYQDLNKTN